MKSRNYLISLLTLCTFLFVQQSNAQHCSAASGTGVCTANQTLTTVGFYPPYDSLPCAVVGVAFDQTIQFHTPATVTQGSTTYNLNWIRIDTVSNLPCGMCWRSNSSNNQINANTTGCIRVTGTTFDAPGQYKIHVIASANVTVGIFPVTIGNQNAESLGVRYYARVQLPGGSCPFVDTSAAGNQAHAAGSISAPVITGNQTICTGGSSTFAATGNNYYAYVWNTGALTSSINVSSAGTYTVTVYGNCTTATSSRVLTVNSPPTASITPATSTICSGASATLTASGGGTYSWSNSATSAAITVSPTTATTYTVTVTGANTCTAIASRLVNVNTPPTASITPVSSTICSGGSATLTASGGGTYLWSNSNTNAAITVSPTSQTTYTVTVTDANTCTATASRIVNVNQPPAASISPASVTICSGANATLTASGGGTYLWGDNSTNATLSVSPSGTTTYSVTVTNANTCTATASRIVNVNQSPTASILPASSTICSGANVTLTASGGNSYQWSNNASTPAITVSPNLTATYTVTVTDQNTCTGSASRTVNVNQPPVATVTPSSISICTGGNTTLIAGGGGTYLWSDNSTGASLNVSPLSTATYSVTVTDPNTCTASASGTVTVTSGLNAAISPNNITICSGANTTLTASGGTSYLWSDNSTNAALTVSPNTQTTYSVTVSDGGGCSATASRTVNVNQSPTTSVSPASQDICVGSNATLTATGGGTYSWSNSSANPSITVSPASPITYSVTVTDLNNCTASASGDVNVHALPVASIAPGSAAICNGDNQLLTASGGGTYAWSTNETTAAITVTPNATTTYTVTATDANLCSASASRIVGVTTVSTTLQASGPVTFCTGGSVTLDAGPGFDTYTWTGGATTQTITVSTSGSYTCTVTLNGCSGTSNTITVTETASSLTPVISGTPSLNICPGGSATLDAGSGYDTYGWSNSTSGQTISTSVAGTYTVTVTLGACSGTASADVAVGNFPVAVNISPSGPVSVCSGTPVTLDAGSGFDSYSWTGGATSQTLQPTQSGTYVVNVTKNFCSGTGTVDVTFNSLPQVSISPSSTAICSGGSTTLVASSSSTYLWSDNSAGQSLVVSPSSQSTYSVTVTDLNNCTAFAEATVDVNTPPTAIITPSSTAICNGDNTTLAASNAVSYLWSDNSTGAQLVVSPTSPSTYSLTVTDANQCTGSASATVDVNAIPAASISPSSSNICNGQNATLTAGGTGTYLWSDNSTGTSISVSPVSNASYSLTVTNSNNCSASATATVSVTTLSGVITAAGPTTFCSGGSVILNATLGATTYSWSNGGTADNINVTTSGTYQVTITEAACTVTSNPITVTVIPSSISVSITASPSLNICSGAVAVLDAGSGFSSYLWSDGSNTHLLATDVSGTYTVTVTQGGCAATAAATVNVGSFPVTVSIAPSGAQACSGDSILLDAGNGHSDYTWSNGDVTQQVFVHTTGNFDVTVTDDNGCTGTSTASVLFNGTPVPSPTPTGTQTICEGESVTLSAGAIYDTYLWSNGSTASSISVSAAGDYLLTVTQNGCSGTSANTITVNVNAAPSVSVSPAVSQVCTGSSATLTVTGTGSYLWSDNSTGTSITVSPSNQTAYSVTLTDANSCTASATGLVSLNPTPIVSISSSEPSNAVCAGSTATLTAVGGNGFAWSTTETTANITVGPASPTTYSVTVTDVNSCTGTASQAIAVNALPTPSVTVNQIGSTADYILRASPTALPGYIWQFAVNQDTTGNLNVNLPTNVDTFQADCIGNSGYYRVLVTDANGCSATSAYALVPTCTGIDELPQLVHFAVMPNPASDVLNVVYELNQTTPVKISVVDLTGRTIMDVLSETEASGKYQQTIHLNSIAGGIYLLNFMSARGSFNTRFVKQ